MNKDRDKEILSPLNREESEQKRARALVEACRRIRENLKTSDPRELARKSALNLEQREGGGLVLIGQKIETAYQITLPDYTISRLDNREVSLQSELLWLHYLDRADGEPLSGRWVNLSEIGGLFYQQAFQGYCGDALADYWQDNLKGLETRCRETGGWPLQNLGDLAYQWRVLPRLPVCLCYRKPSGGQSAWATMLFDAATEHYCAADVAATMAKWVADKLMKPTVN